MKIHIRYFAVLRERLKCSNESIELGAHATVAAALEQLTQQHPPIAALTGVLRTAVNQDFVGPEHELCDGDELALIPPVAGGSESPAPRLARIVDSPPSVTRCRQHVVTAEMGGVVSFEGIVRRTNRGHTVERLEYEAYSEMADRVLSQLCEEIENEHTGARVAVEHRIGTLNVGELAVAIVAAAPHRAQAFEACRAMIDRLKTRVPIWKKEIGPDGEEWLGHGG